ncbi:MAG: hypothetical protein B6D59_08140 [Campylobacteraceae bacterium 4484_4]|nr:MAG: hypothetical protein B6D59_08140 [Campylobacteraceae bacterium 4484_4]
MCRYDKITIVPFDLGEWPWYDALEESLEEVFGVSVRYHPELPLPKEAYDPSRGQYRGERFLEKLFSLRKDPREIMLGVTKEDLYAPGLNFIFGLASAAGVCVIGLKRLDNRFYGLERDDERYFRRLLTEAVHEIGHVLGLPHCPDPHCVMHFSNSLADTDIKGYRFCPKCAKRVKEAICHR